MITGNGLQKKSCFLPVLLDRHCWRFMSSDPSRDQWLYSKSDKADVHYLVQSSNVALHVAKCAPCGKNVAQLFIIYFHR